MMFLAVKCLLFLYRINNDSNFNEFLFKYIYLWQESNNLRKLAEKFGVNFTEALHKLAQIVSRTSMLQNKGTNLL